MSLLSIMPRSGTCLTVLFTFGISVAASAPPARAEYLPSVRDQSPQLQQVLSSAAENLFDADEHNDQAAMAALESELTRLAAPTTERGLVQALRASVLMRTDIPRAIAAAEESAGLLPTYSGPLFLASTALGYSDQASKATDYLLRAGQIDPQLLAIVPEYEVMNLLHRLSAHGDRDRIGKLASRLLEVGWSGNDVASRSKIAVGAIEGLMAAGETERARELVSYIVEPRKARSLLIDRRYEALWPMIETWGGTKLEKMWRIYLQQVRERWVATETPGAAAEYFFALDAAGHDATITFEMMPLLSGPIDPAKADDLLPVIARAAAVLARQGDWAGVDALYRRAAQAWPLGSGTRALNISANHARYLLQAGNAGDALRLIDASIADASSRGVEVNRDAIAAMELERVCMLTELGRSAETGAGLAKVEQVGSPVQVARANLCLDRHDAAVAALIRGLEQREWRSDVLTYVQLKEEAPLPSEYSRKQREKSERLRTDPRLIDRLEAYGRVLEWRLRDSAPLEGAKQAPHDDITV